MEPNPYESPQTEIGENKPQRAAEFSIVRVGVALVLLYALAWLVTWLSF